MRAPAAVDGRRGGGRVLEVQEAARKDVTNVVVTRPQPMGYFTTSDHSRVVAQWSSAGEAMWLWWGSQSSVVRSRRRNQFPTFRDFFADRDSLYLFRHHGFCEQAYRPDPNLHLNLVRPPVLTATRPRPPPHPRNLRVSTFVSGRLLPAGASSQRWLTSFRS